MKLINLTFPTPAENLACDEALLDYCEEGHDEEILRFWHSDQYFVVLGHSRKSALDVILPYCHNQNIPILRRSSGGGTVLQGPGCLNYALILKIGSRTDLRNVSSSNLYIMERHRNVLEKLINKLVEIEGITDLTVNSFKFSGNAQRRKKRFVLFHGTFLVNFDFGLMEKVLRMPSERPIYRQSRPHAQFLTNVSVSEEKIKAALASAWEATDKISVVPKGKIEELVKTKYTQETWNFKF
jgi:lipoate-protein ligase A